MFGPRIAHWLVVPLLTLHALHGPAHGQHSWEDMRKLEAMWEESRDVWWEGKGNLTDGEKYLLFPHFEPDRELTRKQKDCILRIADLLLRKELRNVEGGSAGWLGDMGHSYCIPPLLAVLRDEADNKEVRAKAAYALARITDKRVVDALIDTLTDGDAWVGGSAWESLNGMLGFRGFAVPPGPHPCGDPLEWRDDLAWRKETQAKFRAWWKKNQHGVLLRRDHSGQVNPGVWGAYMDPWPEPEPCAEGGPGCRKLWEDCKEVWFEGREKLSAAEKRKRFENFAPDRKLTANQRDCILLMWDRLLDKKFPCRCEIPGWLGDMGHAYCLPPLLAVLRDRGEPAALRSRCVRAISSIADRRSAGALIDTLGDENPDVSRAADEGLAAMLGSFYPKGIEAGLPPLGPQPKEEEALRWRNGRRDKYRAWWQENRDRVKLSRANVLGAEEQDTGEPMGP